MQNWNWNWKKAGIRSAALLLGSALLLPGVTHAAGASVYTAKEGDTFWLLSKKWGMSVQTLMNANPKVNPLNIYGGLKLNVPSGSAKATMTQQKAQILGSAKSVTTSAGKSLSYSKVLNVKASAYSASVEENAWGPIDYFGNPLKLGTIAVDPKVIPLGSKVYVTGYKFNGLPQGGLIAKATDSGSAIKGNRIDIFIPGSRDFVSSFGYQDVKIYILK